MIFGILYTVAGDDRRFFVDAKSPEDARFKFGMHMLDRDEDIDGSAIEVVHAIAILAESGGFVEVL